ncbi:MAG: cytochrome P450 [Mycobacteriaceae bacterium]|nr:cytochrome P450 [Mycobacteriaceae bacterium]
MRFPVTRRVKSTVAHLTEHYPAAEKPLADPPPDSGLRPVMGTFGPPFLGFAPMVYDQLGFVRRRWERYGPVQWSGMVGQRVVGITGPEALEAVYLDREKALSCEQGYGFFIGPFFRRGLLLLDADEHRFHRRIMQQAFTRPRLRDYLDLMNPGIARDLADWRPDPRFLLYRAAKRMLLDLAAEVFVGTELGPESREVERAFIAAVGAAQAWVRAPVPGTRWARGVAGRRYLERYFRDRIDSKRDSDGADLFSVLCRARAEDGAGFSDDDVVNHMIFALMAAHDTSTITIAIMGYYLGKHPEWQDRVRAESQALATPAASFDDLDRLVSLDLVMKESLRMNGPVGVQLRKTTRDTQILGHYLPADTLLLLNGSASMRLGQWWPDPDVFDPERFAEGRREELVHRYAWCPFGAGAHKCIGMYFAGMAVKAVMHQLLLRYRWTVPEDYEMPLAWGTGPLPADGLPVRLESVTPAAAASRA